MAKPSLSPEFDQLEWELIRTFLAGHKQYRPDLPYPESHSDMQAGIRALIKKYDIKLRDVPLDWKDMLVKSSHET